MNKSELVDAIVAESAFSKKTVAEILRAFEHVVVDNVSRGEKIVLSGFLSFERVERKARTVRNPQTGEAIQVRSSRAPKVSIGSTFKKAVTTETPGDDQTLIPGDDGTIGGGPRIEH